MQFGFMPGRSTTDAIFILRQLQERFLSKRKNLYFAFVDLEKAFDRVPRAVLWWALRKLSVDEWVVRIVQSMYCNAQSQIRVGNDYSEPVNVTVGVHQGSVLSPLLFIIVMEALSQEFRTGCPWELLYADDLVIAADSLDMLKDKLRIWKNKLEEKGLKVNVGKTKVMCSSRDAPKTVPKSRYPCGVCSRGVGANSIFCSYCKKWVHKGCSGIKGLLSAVQDFKCKTCTTPQERIRLMPDKIFIDQDEFESVIEFCYLGDMLAQAGGCVDAVTARIRSAWKAFHDHLPIITNRGIASNLRGDVFAGCVRRVLLYGSETWPLSSDDVRRLERCDHSMIRWICGVKMEQRHAMADLRWRLKLPCMKDLLSWNRLRLFGHRCRQDESLWTKKIISFDVDGPAPWGRPRLRWIDVVESDLRRHGLSRDSALDRNNWRNAIKPRLTQHDRLQPTMSGQQSENAQ